MTLLMIMFRPEGVWQSVDYRVTLNGKPIHDATTKQLSVHCPSSVEGTPLKLLLGFTGAAEMRDRTPVVQWVRETLRGESRVIDETLDLLRDRLERDAKPKEPLIFAGAILEPDGRKVYVEIANVNGTGEMGPFEKRVVEVNDTAFFFGGSGARRISPEDVQRVHDQLQLRPSSWEDHLGLLASINRRVAAKTKTVSPWCHVSFACIEQDGVQSKVFRRPGEPELSGGLAVLLFGIDMTESMEALMRKFKGVELDPAEQDAMNRRMVEGRH